MSQFPRARQVEDPALPETVEVEATGEQVIRELVPGESAAPATPVDRDLPAAGAPRFEPQYPENPASRYHTVAPGETLVTIAEQYYGDASCAARIFDANQDRLANPDLIYPGQELAIPE
ncbi:MAG: LysM peptidoglycan-binding domain-containing protein [Dehalococcoidia bacterium]|nr:LysM peptidoglycan-binding domain-containing protein [Dehalococcoidia bacterium]